MQCVAINWTFDDHNNKYILTYGLARVPGRDAHCFVKCETRSDGFRIVFIFSRRLRYHGRVVLTYIDPKQDVGGGDGDWCGCERLFRLRFFYTVFCRSIYPLVPRSIGTYSRNTLCTRILTLVVHNDPSK